MLPCLPIRSSVSLDEMRSEPSLESFILLISNSTKKRFKGKKKIPDPNKSRGKFTVA